MCDLFWEDTTTRVTFFSFFLKDPHLVAAVIGAKVTRHGASASGAKVLTPTQTWR
jgi:hypothetical protein